MAFIGEVIYEDYLYKFTGKSRSILWGKGNPWREKYFILKRVGNKPVLELFNKKPKNKNALPKGKVELWPSFRVEKIANMKNRAYVFQITTPNETVCLSTDEQRNMDIFPENSESQRRIGGKGTSCFLHSNRSVLAQWPLKSVRSYESSERGQLSLEAGRVAPMGDGVYVFHTEHGVDNTLYDLIDRYVLDALEQIQPGQRGGPEEVEDYVIEAERLLGLTVVSACTPDSLDIRHTLQENWCFDVPSLNGHESGRPRPVVHSRSTASITTQNSVSTSRSVPARILHTAESSRGSPQVPRSLPAFQNSPQGTPNRATNQNSPLVGPRRGSNQSQSSLADRPPAPPPGASGIPTKTLPSTTQGSYLHMQGMALRSASSPGSPFTPSPADWYPPPSFSAAMRQTSTSPINENGPYQPDSYLHPSSSPLGTSTPANKNAGNQYRDQYLTPLSNTRGGSPELNTNNDVRPKDTYLGQRFIKHKTVSPKINHNHRNLSLDHVVPSPKPSPKVRARRLRSASCEDLSDYLRQLVYDPVSKSMNDLLDDKSFEGEDPYLGPEPFPRLHSFSGAANTTENQFLPENYYNIEGLKGKIYDAPGLTVAEARRRFSKRSLSRIRRSISNPNFIGSLKVERLNEARIDLGIVSSHSSPSHSRSSSLLEILPDALRKKLHKDSHHPGSHGALSAGTASHPSSKASSRASSGHPSPYNSLPRKNKTPKEEIVATTSVRGINITRKSRSFRKQKHQENDTAGNDASPTLPRPDNHSSMYQSMGVHSDHNDAKGHHSDSVGTRGQYINGAVGVLESQNVSKSQSESIELKKFGSNSPKVSKVKSPPKVAVKPKAAAKPLP
ncbi:hypothetical protein MAR_033051 [Mya arenaria]|uniref:IRS-type PTB domain-containing protein n=1 Tax=Mya arenaria TaxID=6604 RepID=A0ABY7GAD0_MYAAR|nr:hypothetical protein MAR_033051 [Mya arenaria]